MRRSQHRVVDQLASLASSIWHSATQRVMSVAVVGMLMSLAVDVLIATRLGADVTADALIIALGLPRLIETVGREGTRLSLLALFSATRKELDTRAYHEYVSGLLNLFMGFGLASVILAWILAPQIVTLLGPGLATHEVLAQATVFFRACMPLVLFALGSTVLGVYLNSEQHFVVVSSRNAVVSLAVIAALVLSWQDTSDVVLVAGSYAFGHAVFFVLLIWYGTAYTGFRYSRRALPDRSSLVRLKDAVIYPLLALGIRQGSRLVERALASLVAPGGVAAYYFAFRLASAAQTIIGVSIATTGLPKITKYATENDTPKFLATVKQQIKRTVLVSVPLALFVALGSAPLVSLVYGRGALDDSSAQMIADVLRYFGVAIVFWSLVPVLGSALYARQKYSWVLINVIFVTVVNLLLAWWLSKYLGLNGIALAAGISLMISVVIQAILIYFSAREKTEHSFSLGGL